MRALAAPFAHAPDCRCSWPPESDGAAANAVPITNIGDAPRYTYHAFTPGVYNVSMSLRRSFNSTPERVKFLFQVDCTNVTNKVTIERNHPSVIMWGLDKWWAH